MYASFYQGNHWVGFALFALFLFIFVFSAVVCWAYLPRAQKVHEAAARLPFSDGEGT